jgi:hypothetical protein
MQLIIADCSQYFNVYQVISSVMFHGRTRLTAKFDEYRSEGLFVDARYYIGGREYFAHKLVLARHSGFFRKFFESANDLTVPITLPLPFRGDDTFQFMINFIYTRRLSTERRDLGNLISIRSIAAFYDVDLLAMVSKDLYDKYYRNALKSRPSAGIVLGAISLLKTYNVQPLPDIQNLIDEGSARFAHSQELYIDLVAKYVDVIHGPITPLVTPYILAQLLRRNKPPDREIIQIIEKYVSDQGGQKIDASPLEELIEWDSLEWLKGFSEYNFRWLSDRRMRRSISQVIDRRRTDCKGWNAFVDEAQEHRFCRWHILRWLGQFDACSEKPKEFELFHFLETLNGLTRPVGLCRMGFIQDDSSPSLTLDLGHSVLFANPGDEFGPFVTVGQKEDDRLFVGARFIGFRFLTTEVVCNLSSKINGTEAEFTLDICMDDQWIRNFQKVVPSDKHQAVFSLASQVPSLTAFRIVREPVQTLTAGLINVLRVDSIKVTGSFLPGI